MKILYVLIILLLSCNNAFAQSKVKDRIQLFLPAFSGPTNIGLNASTFLNLQLFKTLRASPYPNPRELNFGSGVIVWDSKELIEQSHQEAEKMLKKSNLLAQIGLWGKVWPYGDGLLVQSYLSLPKYKDFRTQQNEVWSVVLQVNEHKHRLELDLPRRRITFSPFFLTRNFIRDFSNPLAIKIYKKPSFDSLELGRLTNSFRALIIEGNWVYLSSSRKKGWVNIPKYSNNPIEVIDFVGAIMRIYRADWQGANLLFNELLEKEGLATAIKIDILLLQARLLEEMDIDGHHKIESALLLSPFSPNVAAYRIMQKVARLKSLLDAGESVDMKRQKLILSNRLAQDRYLFPPNNSFIQSIETLVNAMEP